MADSDFELAAKEVAQELATNRSGAYAYAVRVGANSGHKALSSESCVAAMRGMSLKRRSHLMSG